MRREHVSDIGSDAEVLPDLRNATALPQRLPCWHANRTPSMRQEVCGSRVSADRSMASAGVVLCGRHGRAGNKPERLWQERPASGSTGDDRPDTTATLDVIYPATGGSAMTTCVTMPAAAVALLGAVTAGAPRAVMDQTTQRLTPHAIAVLVGTGVDFPNGHPVFHNVNTAGLPLRGVW